MMFYVEFRVTNTNNPHALVSDFPTQRTYIDADKANTLHRTLYKDLELSGNQYLEIIEVEPAREQKDQSNGQSTRTPE